MKKLVVVICLVSLLLMSFVSASWFSDLWGKITGNVVEEDCSDGLDGDEDGLTDCDDDDCAYTVTCIPCTDSDGGMDYYTPGVATGIYAGAIPSVHLIYGDGEVQLFDGPGETIYYDHCGDSVQLNEAFCGSDGRLGAIANMCPNGCENGVCIEITDCTEGAIPSSGCYCGGTSSDYLYTSGNCCYSYLLNQLKWTSNFPCTQTCTSIGGVCCSGAGSDCDDWSGTWGVDCQGYVCCTGTCTGRIYHPETPTCSDQGGIICDQNFQECHGSKIGSGDSAYCCSGTCYPPLGNLTCSQQYGTICTADQECQGNIVNSSDSNNCCSGGCYSPGSPIISCGDGFCNSTYGNETVSNCPADCAATPATPAIPATPATPSTSGGSATPVTPATPAISGSGQTSEPTISASGAFLCSQGCLYESICFPVSLRKKIDGVNFYCNMNIFGEGDVAYVWDAQKEADSNCDNHYECRSNFCAEDKCVNQGLLMRILNWFRRLFGIGIPDESNGESNETTTNQTPLINTTNQTS